MLIVRQAKQIRIKERLFLVLILFVCVGCLPGQASDGGTLIPTAIAGETAVTTAAATTPPATTLTSTPTLQSTETSTLQPQPATAMAEPPTATPTTPVDAVPGGPLYPIVDAGSGYLLGGTRNGQWVDAQTYTAYLQDTERPYSLYTSAGYQGMVTGSPPITSGDVCPQPLVPLHPADNLAGAIALVATWEAAPRLAQSLPTDTAVYLEAVATVLQDWGLAEPEVQISSIQRFDVEGDGVDEVLITASRLAASTSAPPVAAGDYSLVVLRWVSGDAVITLPLAVDVYPEANDLAYPFAYHVLGLLDLNGNGRLEIIVAAERYEGHMVTVYEVTASGVQAVLQAGCVQ
jgi:hypothetical protein